MPLIPRLLASSIPSRKRAGGLVRAVIGKKVGEVAAEELAALRASYEAVVLDVGTGDGKHVLHVAKQRPRALVIGLDAEPERMRKASARAAAKPAKGGLPNAMFVWSSVEHLPQELSGVTEVHVLMPWGSLLRGMVGGDDQILANLARACAPGATFLVTLNLHAWRPAVPEVGGLPEPTPESALDTLAAIYARAGWQIEAASYLDDTEIAALSTSWTRRLGSTRDQLEVLGLNGHITA